MSKVQPVIGVTRCSKLEDYIQSVERAGGAPRVLDVADSPRAILGQIDAVLLTGGGDVDPALYGEPRHESVDDAEPGRDEFEIDLARRSMEADVPLLAICRGAQVLNVAAGGTLVQDIPSSIAGPLPHRVTRTSDCIAHEIRVREPSRLHAALGPAVDAACTCRVNSRHHQAIARVGKGLVATATAEDGVVEAIEAPEHRFCVGVQWHPENFWRTGEFSPLFEAFVAAAIEHAERLDVRRVGKQVERTE
jgi:putative glutamine amidotransferase